MITHYEMSTGEVLSTEEEQPRFDRHPTTAAQPRLQTIDVAMSAEPRPTPRLPADLIGIPVTRILARLS